MQTSIVGREQVQEFERWEMPELGAGASRGAAPATVRHLEALEQQAREEGFARGMAEGKAAAATQLAQQVARLSALFDALSRPLDDVDAQVEGELAHLAMAVARQLVRRELKTTPTEVIGAVREALTGLPAMAREVRVSVHPEDAELIRTHLGEASGGRSWQLLEDPMISRGGCLVQSEHSRVDARVESRLLALAGAVLGGQRAEDAAPDPACGGDA
jgi:flagellar assembly protein FliH